MGGHRTPKPDAVLYPFDALVSAMGETSVRGVARALGISGSTEQHYRKHGVSEKVADRLAVKAGLHPYEVWPEMADHVLAAVEVSCRECDERFVPTRPWNVYCSAPCQRRHYSRERMRRIRAANAELRAKEAAYRRQYKATYREHLYRQHRAYYWANRDRLRAQQAAYKARKRAEQRGEEAA